MDRKVGAQLKAARMNASVGEADAAVVAGLSLDEYKACESGTRRAPTFELFKLSQYLECSLAEMFENSDG